MKTISNLLIIFTVLSMTCIASAQNTPAKPTTEKKDAGDKTKKADPPKEPDKKPVEKKPAETKPAGTKPAETKPAETKPAETKPAETKPVSGNAPVTVGREAGRDTNPDNKTTKDTKLSANELRLRQLAELVEDLKNKVTASKYRLQLLKEAMTTDKETLGGAKIQIIHKNEMGGVYRLVRLRYFIDDKLVQSFSDVNSKDKKQLSKKSIDVFSDHITPGNKRIRVFITYLGNGYGLFKYVKEWKWEINNSYSFTVEPGKSYILTVIGKEKGNMTTPLDERPMIKFKLEAKSLVTPKTTEKKATTGTTKK